MSNTVATSSELPEELRADWMTTSEAAEALKKHRCTISKMIAAGELVKHPETYHRQALISRASVQKFLNRFKPQMVKNVPKKKRRA